MHKRMRTSVEIPDALLRKVRSVARKRRTTLRGIMLEGLRKVVDHESRDVSPYTLDDESFGEGGLVELRTTNPLVG